MNLVKNFLFVFLILAISGCASNKEKFQYNINKVTNVSSNGIQEIIRKSAYIQWNDDYAVSVLHGFEDKGKYKSSLTYDYSCNDCDLVFFKNKATKPLSVWKQPEINEDVIHVGFDNNGYIVTSKGIFTGNTIQDSRTMNFWFLLSTAKIQQGFSGGPVYNKQGQILGMSKGFTEKPDYKSLFIDYDSINKEWLKFKNNNNL